MAHKGFFPKQGQVPIPPPRPVRFTSEEDQELQEAAARIGCSISEVIRLCVRTVRPGDLPGNFYRPEDSIREHLIQRDRGLLEAPLAGRKARRKVNPSPKAPSKLKVRVTRTADANGTNGTSNGTAHEPREP